jgi:sulfite exporter TauE/SafE
MVGLILGVRHALDADHVVAVSTIVSKNKNLFKSSLLGAAWGLGHTSTLLLVGLVVLIFKLSIPTKIALSMEFAVGIVLVILGLSVTKEFFLDKIHLHPHEHKSSIHLHLHSHKARPNHSHEHQMKPEHKTFIIGMIHGLAGSAALMLLVLTTVSTLYQGILYILIFGLGSILGMVVISTIISLPFTYTTAKFDELNYRLRLTAGFISILLGIAIIFKIGFMEGLIYTL